jgi:endonuclease/exonuclease/phosphatase family metal-dependent hydrolase
MREKPHSEHPSAKDPMHLLRVVTYNIHKGRGLDRRVRIGRITEVLREIDGDIIALQEVLSIEGKKPEDHQAHFIAHELGFHYRIGETRRLYGGAYGNVTLSRFPFIHTYTYDITQPGREERGCLRTDLQISTNRVLQVYNLHLGTSYGERGYQARKLFDSGILKPPSGRGLRIILGDFNEWISGPTSRLLKDHFKSAPIRPLFGRSRTYPGLLPLVHLDHIYFDEGMDVVKVMVHRSRKALVASDHLPITVDFRLQSG